MIYDVDDPALVRRFGYTYQRGEFVDRIIEQYILDQRTHQFPSMDAFAHTLVGNPPQGPLIIQQIYLYPNLPNPVRIRMTGSHAADYAAANRAAGFGATPGGYTWHHAENIRLVARGQYDCDMYLIQTWYHARVPHAGGVREYEWAMNQRYR